LVKQMNKKISKTYLDWSRYLNLIHQLDKKIDWEKEQFKSIVAINRGGNIPATILSHANGIPLIVLNKGGIIYEREKFLVVDDIAHTGSTLANITYLSQGAAMKYHPLQYANKDFKIATLHYRKESKVKPDYFVESVEKWIVYPYEKE
jgi:hypoxanthine phosphoribosyltransferase